MTIRDGLREAVEELAGKWSGCWCGLRLRYDHDPRMQDCPQHGDPSCRHMAEGITLDLRAALADSRDEALVPGRNLRRDDEGAL